MAHIDVSFARDKEAQNVGLVMRNRKMSQTHSECVAGTLAWSKIATCIHELGITVENLANCQ